MLEEEFDAADELAMQQAQHGQHAGADPAAPADSPRLHQVGPGGSDGGESAQLATPPAAEFAAAIAPAAAAVAPGAPDHASDGSTSSSNGTAPPVAAAVAGPEATSPSVTTAVEFAASVPAALRVSSLTGDGIDGLKGAMLSMLEEAQLAHREGVEGWWGEAEGEDGGGDEDLGELIFHDDEEHRQHEAYMYD